MICNVIDRRTRPYRWKLINAIIEATWHDNTATDADQAEFPSPANEVTYQERAGITVEEAIQWAVGQPCPVTLYLYDDGAGFH